MKRNPIKEHEPLDDEPGLMSPAIRAWWDAVWTAGKKLKQVRQAVLNYVVADTPAPNAPDESILTAYKSRNKLHDKEPALIESRIDAIDPTFFDTYPRLAKTKLDSTFKRKAIGDACKAFYHYGLSAYGKPGLRKKDDPTNGGSSNGGMASL